MTFNPNFHRRRSIRLNDYDYTRAGAYFVTICAFERECLFGEVVDGVMRLNVHGKIAQEEWLLTAELRDYVVLDEYIVMPNHFHAVLMIDDCRGTACRALDDDVAVEQGTARRALTVEFFGQPVAGSLATMIRSFKSAVSKRINILHNNPGAPVWQRNYYERVIRNERELDGIRQYIADNPAKWIEDENHPTR
ncbi:MAG: transposase [Deltaproteobacteria bacterium HGW-Deltaproteobacteria-4]|nr:MAG: transposase [Deltaproteobacteria bacterium HGW-Deltaproteobacteria-4]